MTAETSYLGVPRSDASPVAFVTGAAGFIGRHVGAAFSAAGWRVAAFSHARAVGEGLGEAPVDVEWFVGPVSRANLAQAAALVGRPELIVHAAGGSSVGASVADPATDFDRTLGSVREVLEFIRREAAEARLVFLSSAAVYGSASSGTLSESDPLGPISPYGLHKKLAEDLICGWADQWSIDASIVRLFSVFGPANRKQLLWEVANRLCARPPRLDLSGTGEEARDFLYIDDAVRLIGMLAGLDRNVVPRVVNGGSGSPTTVREVAESLCRALSPTTEVVFTGAARAGDPKSLVADPTLARQLGFSPQVPFATGLDRFAAWVGEVVVDRRVRS